MNKNETKLDKIVQKFLQFLQKKYVAKNRAKLWKNCAKNWAKIVQNIMKKIAKNCAKNYVKKMGKK